jgi:hypothetical protein
MLAIETLAMVMSSTAMKLAIASMTAVSHRRRLAAELAWSRTWSVTLRVDGRGHGQADAQRMRRQFLRLSAIRTGTRCTTLIQLPVAFCAGITAKAEPVPPPMPVTLP